MTLAAPPPGTNPTATPGEVLSRSHWAQVSRTDLLPRPAFEPSVSFPLNVLTPLTFFAVTVRLSSATPSWTLLKADSSQKRLWRCSYNQPCSPPPRPEPLQGISPCAPRTWRTEAPERSPQGAAQTSPKLSFSALRSWQFEPRQGTLFCSQLYLSFIDFRSSLYSNSINLLLARGKYFLDLGFLDRVHICCTLTAGTDRTTSYSEAAASPGTSSAAGGPRKDQAWE